MTSTSQLAAREHAARQWLDRALVALGISPERWAECCRRCPFQPNKAKASVLGRRRVVFVLHGLYRLSFPECAEATGLSTSTVQEMWKIVNPASRSV